MNPNAIFQPAFIGAHLAALSLLVAIAAGYQSKRWASALSFIAILSAGIASTIGFVMVLGISAVPSGPGIIAPIVFAGGLMLGLGAYIIVLIIAWWLRPRPLQFDGAIIFVAILGFVVVNGSCLLLPAATTATVTVRLRGSDSEPISGARFLYESRLKGEWLSATSDSNGLITLNIMHGDTIDGRFEPTPKHLEAKLYISAPDARSSRWSIQRQWAVVFGSTEITAHNFFLTDFDNPKDRSIEVYLSSSSVPNLMPYSQLKDLAGRLTKAQQTGDMFNPEMIVQNLESYVQLAEVARAYDPRSPVCNYAQNIFTYFRLGRDELGAVLRKLTAPEVSNEVKTRGLSQMMSILAIPDTSPASSWEVLRDKIQAKLNADLATLNNVPKP